MGNPPQEPYPGFDDNVHAQYDQQVRQRAAAQAGRPVQRVDPLDVIRGRVDVPGLAPETRAAYEQAQGKLNRKFIGLAAFFGILLLLGIAALAGKLL